MTYVCPGLWIRPVREKKPAPALTSDGVIDTVYVRVNDDQKKYARGELVRCPDPAWRFVRFSKSSIDDCISTTHMDDDSFARSFSPHFVEESLHAYVAGVRATARGRDQPAPIDMDEVCWLRRTRLRGNDGFPSVAATKISTLYFSFMGALNAHATTSLTAVSRANDREDGLGDELWIDASFPSRSLREEVFQLFLHTEKNRCRKFSNAERGGLYVLCRLRDRRSANNKSRAVAIQKELVYLLHTRPSPREGTTTSPQENCVQYVRVGNGRSREVVRVNVSACEDTMPRLLRVMFIPGDPLYSGDDYDFPLDREEYFYNSALATRLSESICIHPSFPMRLSRRLQERHDTFASVLYIQMLTSTCVSCLSAVGATELTSLTLQTLRRFLLEQQEEKMTSCTLAKHRRMYVASDFSNAVQSVLTTLNNTFNDEQRRRLRRMLSTDFRTAGKNDEQAHVKAVKRTDSQMRSLLAEIRIAHGQDTAAPSPNRHRVLLMVVGSDVAHTCDDGSNQPYPKQKRLPLLTVFRVGEDRYYSVVLRFLKKQPANGSWLYDRVYAMVSLLACGTTASPSP